MLLRSSCILPSASIVYQVRVLRFSSGSWQFVCGLLPQSGADYRLDSRFKGSDMVEL